MIHGHEELGKDLADYIVNGEPGLESVIRPMILLSSPHQL